MLSYDRKRLHSVFGYRVPKGIHDEYANQQRATDHGDHVRVAQTWIQRRD